MRHQIAGAHLINELSVHNPSALVGKALCFQKRSAENAKGGEKEARQEKGLHSHSELRAETLNLYSHSSLEITHRKFGWLGPASRAAAGCVEQTLVLRIL